MKISLMIVALLICGPRVFADEAAAPSVCDSLKSIHDDNADLRLKNCLSLLDDKSIPNTEALQYSLKFLGDNYGKLADPACADASISVKKGVLSKDQVEKGIQNGCQFVLNDLNSKYEGAPNRSNAYYVDLCEKDPKKVVTAFYMNKGTGTSKHGYSDQEGAHSTVAGAFLTDSDTFHFVPFKMSSGYKSIKKKLGDLPALRLVGLNASNNGTDFGKPIHVSPYQSSWGCPSVGADDAWVLEKLAENGPSLLMNYGPSVLHKSTTVCDNTQGLAAITKPIATPAKGSGHRRKGGRR